jgi:dTDP-6-deoxy-L-talose 4-dehydrogenase (NAD+)
MGNEKSITITGAGGYIGRHVVSALLDKGISVTAVDINTDRIDSRANKISMNIFDSDDILYERLNKPQICLHLAWQDGFNHNANSHIINLPKHFMFIQNLLNSGIKHLAIMGSMHEIGYWEGKVDENTPTNPNSFYGIAKNSLRQTVQIMTKEKRVIFQWLRAFYIIGDDLSNNSIFSKISKMEQEGKSFFPFTTGENKYDFIDVNDLADQIAMSIIQEEITGIINCCSGKPISLKEQVEQFIEEKQLKIRPDYGKFPERPYDSPAIWGDSTKIEKIMSRIDR